MLFLFGLVKTGQAQDMPAVSGSSVYQGFSLPAAGEMTYSFTGSESARFGYYGSVLSSSAVSANLAYLSGSQLNPFHLTYSGGFQHQTGYSGTNRGAQVFQNVIVSQDFHHKLWSFGLNDRFSYLPDAPVGGISGIPGLGDVGVTPGGDPNQTTLSNLATRISNAGGATASRSLTGRTSLQFSLSDSLLKFTGANVTNAISNNSIDGSVTMTHALSPIRNYFVDYSASRFSYPDLAVPFSFFTQSFEGGYSGALSRKTKYSLSAGPQITSTTTVLGHATTLDANIKVMIDHEMERGTMSALYTRSIRGGSGVTPGARNSVLSGEYSYRLTRLSSLSADLSYTNAGRISSLSTTDFSTNTFTASVQGARQVGRFLSGYISYTLLKQSLSGSAVNSAAFSGLSHVLAGGITYTPRSIHLSHK